MKKIILAVIPCCLITACKNENPYMDEKVKDFISKYEQELAPLEKASAIAYWDASISGKDEDYAKVEQYSKELTAYFADKEKFSELKEVKEKGLIKDSLLQRQFDRIYYAFLENQADIAKLHKAIELQTQIEQKYSKFRADVKGVSLTDNQIDEALKTSTDNQYLESVWNAHKNIGNVVAADIIELVKVRNEIAKELGFANYHDMSLKMSEQDPQEILQLFDELDQLTSEAFSGLKKEMDAAFAARYKVEVSSLKPWHYQDRFFQEAPNLYPVNLDAFYKKQNIEQLTSDFFSGIGLPIDDMLKNSDLYEKEGKNQHAYCINTDKLGDVRVLCNIQASERWMGTMLHEFGHAVYDQRIDRNVPYVLRDPAHIFTTEAIAMLFGRLSSNVEWMKAMGLCKESDVENVKENGFKQLRLTQLVFSRWAQVMYRFEKEMYANPDQDLNALWWNLVEKYQMLKKPEGRNAPDWAAKIHIATSPCYYHNYLMGELLASQLNNYICKNILQSENIKTPLYNNNKAVGEYLLNKVFKVGAVYYWNDMIEKATGEKLTAQYYAEQFVK